MSYLSHPAVTITLIKYVCPVTDAVLCPSTDAACTGVRLIQNCIRRSPPLLPYVVDLRRNHQPLSTRSSPVLLLLLLLLQMPLLLPAATPATAAVAAAAAATATAAAATRRYCTVHAA